MTFYSILDFTTYQYGISIFSFLNPLLGMLFT